MRKCLVIRKDERGVSPVIATILMVAITVVLAAVLYVMVTGLLGGGTQVNPAVTFGPTSNPSLNTWSATCAAVTGIAGQHTLSSWEVQVLNGTATAITSQSLANFAVPAGVTGAGITLKLTDVGGSTGGGKLSAGDIFTISGVGAGNQYKALLIWKQTGGQAAEIIFNA